MQTPKPGTIVYYVEGFDLRSAIFCAPTHDKDFVVVYPLQETNIVKDEHNNEHYACNRVRFNELYNSPAEALDATLSKVRQKLETSLSEVAKDDAVSQNPQKGTSQALQGKLTTLDALMLDPNGPRVRKAYSMIYINGRNSLYMAYLTTTDRLGFRIYMPGAKGTRMPNWCLTEDIHVKEMRAPIWSSIIRKEWEQEELAL